MLEIIIAIFLGSIAYLLLRLFSSDGETYLYLNINGKDIINYRKIPDGEDEKEAEEENE